MTEEIRRIVKEELNNERVNLKHVVFWAVVRVQLWWFLFSIPLFLVIAALGVFLEE